MYLIESLPLQVQKQPLHAGEEVRRGNELLHHALPLLEKVLGLQLVPEVVVINLRYEDEFLARVVDRERVVCLSPMIRHVKLSLMCCRKQAVFALHNQNKQS